MKTINIIGETIISLPPAGDELLLLLPYVSLRAEGEAISSLSSSLLRRPSAEGLLAMTLKIFISPFGVSKRGEAPLSILSPSP